MFRLAVMCNRYGYNSPHHRLVELFAEVDLPFRWPEASPNLPALEEIRPTDPAPVVQAFEDGVRLDSLRWGFPPANPKAGPVINFRSENRRFERGRCLVPATHFFEFTGEKYPKTKWRFTAAGADVFAFAGLVRDDRFTLLTCAPGPDVAPYHDRQPVILKRADWADWLRTGEAPLAPLPAGSLDVEKAS
ncbi:MAG TPA: SOS response-associated peptidase [Caulobacteraceae bacterium]|nr:SOS response-associated peptidase [Caulobacteraceae bacterium]